MRRCVSLRPVRHLLGWAFTLAVSGCALFPNLVLDSVDTATDRSAATDQVPKAESVALEIFFVERPADDLLMGEPLWKDLDQIGSVPTELRERLERNGIRFGLSGKSTPYALRSLTGDPTDRGPGFRTLRNRYEAPSGVTHQLQCGEWPDGAPVQIHNPEGSRTKEFVSARGVVSCRVERTQGGWARVEIEPQVHHGVARMRPVAAAQQWDWGGGQEVDHLYGQRFSVDLNEGRVTGTRCDGRRSRHRRSTALPLHRRRRGTDRATPHHPPRITPLNPRRNARHEVRHGL
ncbi:MAG: hypothetical protein R3B90_12800 [Planctomycetaceae bacterium]